MAISLTAPAKINLNLKISGKRADGYHQLVSLAGFSIFGDTLHFEAASEDSLQLTGSVPAELDANDNLIAHARDGLRNRGFIVPPTKIVLEKQIPVGGGLGGGSTDAAATLRGLMQLYALDVPSQDLHELALTLGADVPVCLNPQWQIMSSIGEVVSPLASDSAMPFIVLANPGQHVSTPKIFSALGATSNDATELAASDNQVKMAIEGFWHQADWTSLISVGNDLEAPATTICPEITGLLSDMTQLCHRSCEPTEMFGIGMSGSGASCFGLFKTASAADNVAAKLTQQGYWAIASKMHK